MTNNKDYDKAVKEVIKRVKEENAESKKRVHSIKRSVCSDYGLKEVISDTALYLESGLNVFKRKPSRRKSGVSVIAVMTSPSKCPHGKCVFCPGGVEFMTPQSYTGEEPAALRGKRNDYDPYKQVKNRIKQYYAIGQTPSKVELIIMGGTFTHRKWSYQKRFIRECFNALNDEESDSLEQAHKINETAKHRCVGLTIETRPDEINESVIKKLLKLGATRVELGVQSVYDEVLKESNRGHSVSDVVKATRLLKNSGFKINYHLMTNMPGSDKRLDYNSFKIVFTDERFKPDMIKIYPTLLIKGTELYEMYEEGEWTPYSLKETIRLIAKIKRLVPHYVRIMRIQRDVPSFKIEQDLKKSNLRQLVKEYMKVKGWKCECIRCREAGRNENSNLRTARLKKCVYKASEGIEFFIEYTDVNNFLFGFIRGRMVENGEVLFVRELHVYGSQTSIGKEGEIQHKGIGSKLLSELERIAESKGIKRIDVISGVGVRGYYENKGYELRGYYMSKCL